MSTTHARLVGRPLTWDAAIGRRMWEAGVSPSVIADWAKVTSESIHAYARLHQWPERGTLRRWPCCDCGEPKTAVRKRTRCTNCSRLNRQRNNSAAEHVRTRKAAVRVPAEIATSKATSNTTGNATVDPIALYRAEKAARDERRAGETNRINAIIDAARVAMNDENQQRRIA